jgi:hypothetical protein
LRAVHKAQSKHFTEVKWKYKDIKVRAAMVKMVFARRKAPSQGKVQL